MNFPPALQDGVNTIRQWARNQGQGRTSQTDDLLKKAMRALIEDYRVEHDVPGIRYFEILFLDESRNRHYVTRRGTESNPHDIVGKKKVATLTRSEFLARQAAWRSYDQHRFNSQEKP